MLHSVIKLNKSNQACRIKKDRRHKATKRFIALAESSSMGGWKVIPTNSSGRLGRVNRTSRAFFLFGPKVHYMEWWPLISLCKSMIFMIQYFIVKYKCRPFHPLVTHFQRQLTQVRWLPQPRDDIVHLVDSVMTICWLTEVESPSLWFGKVHFEEFSIWIIWIDGACCCNFPGHNLLTPPWQLELSGDRRYVFLPAADEKKRGDLGKAAALFMSLVKLCCFIQ